MGWNLNCKCSNQWFSTPVSWHTGVSWDMVRCAVENDRISLNWSQNYYLCIANNLYLFVCAAETCRVVKCSSTGWQQMALKTYKKCKLRPSWNKRIILLNIIKTHFLQKTNKIHISKKQKKIHTCELTLFLDYFCVERQNSITRKVGEEEPQEEAVDKPFSTFFILVHEGRSLPLVCLFFCHTFRPIPLQILIR